MGDAQSFRSLAVRSAPEGVQVLDCVVVSGDRWWSLGRLLTDRGHGQLMLLTGACKRWRNGTPALQIATFSRANAT